MFRTIKSGKPPYFREVKGPWIRRSFVASDPQVADINGDGTDDLLVCNFNQKPLMYVQNKVGVFSEVNLPTSNLVNNWRDARIGFIRKAKNPDLVVIRGVGKTDYLHVFKGIPNPPHFNFQSPYYTIKLPQGGEYDSDLPLKNHSLLFSVLVLPNISSAYFLFLAPALEILDANADGYKDIYVVQYYSGIKYCTVDMNKEDKQRFWGDDKYPPKTWEPQLDQAKDILLVGKSVEGDKVSFDKVEIQHYFRGCGRFVEKFDERSLILSEGSRRQAGYLYHLDWGKDPEWK